MTDCVWMDKVNCQKKNTDGTIDIGLSCDECDWKTLEYSKEAIIKRIGIETNKMKKLYMFAKQRKANEINDIMSGIVKMYEILEKDFGVKNPIKDSNIYSIIRQPNIQIGDVK